MDREALQHVRDIVRIARFANHHLIYPPDVLKEFLTFRCRHEDIAFLALQPLIVVEDDDEFGELVGEDGGSGGAAEVRLPLGEAAEPGVIPLDPRRSAADNAANARASPSLVPTIAPGYAASRCRRRAAAAR